MSDESMIAAMLAHNDEFETLRELIHQRGTITADELSKVGIIPAELLTEMDSSPVLASRAESLGAILVARVNAKVAVDEKAGSLSWIGNPTSDLQYAGDGSYVRHYEGGSVYWTPTFGAHEVHGSIRERYFEMGGPGSYLGFPQTDELSWGAVRYSNFQGGTIYWPSDSGDAYLTPSYSPNIKKTPTGIYLLSSGTGFTPGGRVSILIVNEGLQPETVGSTYAEADGRFGTGNPHTCFVRFRLGDHPSSVARAHDDATGKSSDYPLSYPVQ